jgi:hypothetical protein
MSFDFHRFCSEDLAMGVVSHFRNTWWPRVILEFSFKASSAFEIHCVAEFIP